MIFIDSGAFIAQCLSADANYRHAVSVWAGLEKSKETCITSSPVLFETTNLIGRRDGNAFAAELAYGWYRSRYLKILRPTEEDEILAIGMLEKYADQKIGLTDCLSFVLMKREKVNRVFTLDRHFRSAGFTTVP
ncbi:MAG: PIN domain-containing protein [Planctomycetes bacterium]|nr:PIN domain-containing protein [Planctomycetota bacterium]